MVSDSDSDTPPSGISYQITAPLARLIVRKPCLTMLCSLFIALLPVIIMAIS
jgi:hypothetical protein